MKKREGVILTLDDVTIEGCLLSASLLACLVLCCVDRERHHKATSMPELANIRSAQSKEHTSKGNSRKTTVPNALLKQQTKGKKKEENLKRAKRAKGPQDGQAPLPFLSNQVGGIVCTPPGLSLALQLPAPLRFRHKLFVPRAVRRRIPTHDCCHITPAVEHNRPFIWIDHQAGQ